jgi:hypothetical protein
MKTFPIVSSLNRKQKMKNRIIHPEHQEELSYWAGKWGISVRQLQLAIIDTGQVNVKFLKAYLRHKGFLFSFRKLFLQLKKTGNQLKDRGHFSTVPVFIFFKSPTAQREQRWHNFLSTSSIKTDHETPVRLYTFAPADNDAFL